MCFWVGGLKKHRDPFEGKNIAHLAGLGQGKRQGKHRCQRPWREAMKGSRKVVILAGYGSCKSRRCIATGRETGQENRDSDQYPLQISFTLNPITPLGPISDAPNSASPASGARGNVPLTGSRFYGDPVEQLVGALS
jgi:hypothetical protein